MKVKQFNFRTEKGVIKIDAGDSFVEIEVLSKDEIKNLVGDRVAILDFTSDEKKWAKVSEIEIANSIIDKKNIHICLGSSIKLSDIKPNSDIIFIPK